MRRAFLLACVVFTTLSAAATPPDEDVLRPHIPSEGQLYVEPHLGLNFTMLSADPLRERFAGEGELDIYRSAFGIAPLFGVTVGYQFSPTIGVELDLSYDGRNASNSGTSSDGCVITDVFGDTIENRPMVVNKDYSVGVNSLSLGFNATYGFESVFFFLGPQVSIPMSNSFEETMVIGDGACQYFFPTRDSTKTLVGSLRGAEAATRVSFRLGAAVRVRIGDRMELIPRIAYDLGLTDTYSGVGTIRYTGVPSVEGRFHENSTFDESLKLNALQASLGLRITL